ncbi:MAG: hypothetical protein AAF378_24975 [Cyanobacteria bacterium P01_A01_bin.84]
MKKLISEQLPNDGGYYIKPLVDEANARLKRIGRQGKRATIKAGKSSLSLQFTFADEQGKKQRNPGLGAIPLSPGGIQEAERIATAVTHQLEANNFSWEWFNKRIGKPTPQQIKQLTCKEMVEQYKKHYFKQRKANKKPEASWYRECQKIEDILINIDKSLSAALVKQVIESTDNNTPTRVNLLNGLVGFLKYFDNTDYKTVIKTYKNDCKIIRKPKEIPSDLRIQEVYENGFDASNIRNTLYIHRPKQWQFLYSLLAIYGLRIHEAWNIANWDKPVTLKNGDWVTIDVDTDNETSMQVSNNDFVVPAILDPEDKSYLLCIKHDTKTGFRMVFPLSPEGHDWIKEFNLLQPLNLPDIPNPLGSRDKNRSKYNCSDATSSWFHRKKYGFTAHALRHAYTIRGHVRGCNPKALADSGGHSLAMSATTYLRHMGIKVKYDNLIKEISKEQEKRTDFQLLEQENQSLKSKLEAKENEIKLLKTELKMLKAIEESKGQK